MLRVDLADGFAFGLGQTWGERYLHFHQQVAGRATFRGRAMPLDSQLLTAGGSRGNVQGNRPARRGHIDARSSHGLAQGDR